MRYILGAALVVALSALPAAAQVTKAEGLAADGAAAKGNPVQMGGVDASGNVQATKVGTDGSVSVSTTGTGTATIETAGVSTTISNATASTLIAAAAGARRITWVQNTGTVILLCKLGAAATASDFHAALAAGVANDDGKGGFWSIGDWTGTVTCIAASGTGRAVFGAY